MDSSLNSCTEIEILGNAVADREAGVEDDETKETGEVMDLTVYKAAAEGNIHTLEQHRENLHQILTATKNTVLHVHIAHACQTTTTNMAVEKIIEMCPPLLFQPNQSGDTPLHIAARYKSGHHIVQILLDEAANYHRYSHRHQDSDIEKGISSSSELPAGSNKTYKKKLIQTTNKAKDTALHEAVRFNCGYTVGLLTQSDHEFSYAANEAGDTPLYLAARKEKDSFAYHQILQNCKNPTYGGRNGRTALHAAVIARHYEMTREILEHSKLKALTKAGDERKWTPLHYAALLGHTPIAELLLKSDKSAAYVVDKDCKKTPLHIAASEGHEKVMKLLIDYSPDCCEVVDHKGRNALHHAIESCQIHILAFVLNHPWLSNVLLNGKDVGNTPLLLLARNFPYYYESNYKDDNFYTGDVVYYEMDGNQDPTRRFMVDSRVDKMAFNSENLNALDIILAHDTISSTLKEKVGGILENNGVIRGYHHQIGGGSNEDRSRTKIKSEKAAILKQAIDAHLLVATLIATVTFAAGFTMPGGYHQNENGSNLGFAVFTTRKNTAFKVSVIADTLAMAFSSCAVFIHFYLATVKPKQMSKKILTAISSTMLALFAMVVAFLSATYAVLGDSPNLALHACVLGCSCFGMAFIYLSPLYDKYITYMIKLIKANKIGSEKF